jgi:hypothetical protein
VASTSQTRTFNFTNGDAVEAPPLSAINKNHVAKAYTKAAPPQKQITRGRSRLRPKFYFGKWKLPTRSGGSIIHGL